MGVAHDNADDAAAVVHVKVHRPAAALSGYVTFYYFVSVAGPLTDFLYPEWGNVRFELTGNWRVEMSAGGSETGGDRLFGPTDRCGRVITGGGRIVGFGLTPLGWHRLIGTNASDAANRTVPLGEVFGSATEAIRTALAGASQAEGVAQADAMLVSYAAGCPPANPLVVIVDKVLRDRPHDVVAFAAAVGVSDRTLNRVCLRAFGFPPKRLLRRQRFLDTLGHVRSAVGDTLRGTLDAEYFDQAHFYRDFRDFMGMSPRAYFAASRTLMANAAAAQTAAGITLSFKLPPL